MVEYTMPKLEKIDYGGRQPKANNKNIEMGKITNLIADMSVKGANDGRISKSGSTFNGCY
jgi:hypothetical protein